MILIEKHKASPSFSAVLLCRPITLLPEPVSLVKLGPALNKKNTVSRYSAPTPLTPPTLALAPHECWPLIARWVLTEKVPYFRGRKQSERNGISWLAAINHPRREAEVEACGLLERRSREKITEDARFTGAAIDTSPAVWNHPASNQGARRNTVFRCVMCASATDLFLQKKPGFNQHLNFNSGSTCKRVFPPPLSFFIANTVWQSTFWWSLNF